MLFAGMETTGKSRWWRSAPCIHAAVLMLSPVFLQLEWYQPYAAILWSAHNSLKAVCVKLCDSEFSQRMEQQDDAANEKHGLESYMLQSMVAPQFGTIFSPMLSERTGFASVLDDISRRHRAFIQSEEERLIHAANVEPDCLAFRHPAFSVEPKLDGERFLVHISRNGIVKMHSRQGTWYRYVVLVAGPGLSCMRL
jgi:hypothetical protein